MCLSLKERSLASSVRILVNDIEDLWEAWSTLDTCFDRPEKYIVEALEPVRILLPAEGSYDGGQEGRPLAPAH